MKEEWKTIPGYDPDFIISTKGKVFRISKNTEVAQVLTGIPQYKYVNILTESGERVLRRVHNLMGRAFLENPYNLPIVDHIDRDKMNNDLSNLRWTNESGNRRNLDNSVYIGDVHIKEFVEKYPKPDNACAYLYRLIQTEGYPWEEAVFKYEEYLERGLDRRTLIWRGEEFYVSDFCRDNRLDENLIRSALNQGKDLWCVIYNCPESHPSSVEVKSKTGVGLWIPSRKYLKELLGKGDSWTESAMQGEYFEDWLSYDPLNHLKHTVLGFTGTIPELSKHFGIEECAVSTRMRKGMTLEQALTTPKGKVKVVYVDGVRMSTKAFYESLGLNAKEVNNYRSKTKKTIEEALTFFGVDVSKIDLKY